MGRYKIVFRNDAYLTVQVYDNLKNKPIKSDMKYNLDLIDKIRKDKNNIRNVYFSLKNSNSDRNLFFSYGNFDLEFKNINSFKDDKYFDFIYKIGKNKKLKLEKIQGVIAISLVAPLMFSIISDKKGKINTENSEAAQTYVSDVSQTESYNDIEEITKSNVENNDVLLATNNIKEKEEKTEVTEEENKLDIIETLNVGSACSSEKLSYVKENYFNIIEKYSNMYNVNPDIICAIATQERGVHSNKVDPGGAIGLMQIQVSVWDNQSLTVFNYETNKYETINVTLEKLKDLNFNIKFGCAIYQDCLKQTKGNYIAALQSYNMGCGAVRKMIYNYAENKGITPDDVLDSNGDISWLSYRNSNYAGDPSYVEHVLSYCDPQAFKSCINCEKLSISHK